MLSKTLSGLALVVFTATGASAQAFVQDNFQMNTFGSPQYYDANGQFTTNATGLNTAKSLAFVGVAVNSPFRVWCVDFADNASAGSTYSAWVTPFNSSSFGTHTFTSGGNASGSGGVLTTFEKAVWLIGQENNVQQGSGTTFTLTGAGGYGVMDYQLAIWQIMGYAPGATTKSNALYSAALTANLSFVDVGAWDVINNYTYGDDGDVTRNQEFLYCELAGLGSVNSCYGSGTTLSVTPEPATISLVAMGLVGMAGGAVRRRRQRKA